MNKIVAIFFITLSYFVNIQNIIAQNQILNQVLILNEGHYDYINNVMETPVTVGSYNPATQVYTEVTNIPNARFASDIKIDGNYYYIAADSLLLKYDINTYQLVASQTIKGIRKIAVWENQILVSRGEYLTTFDSYFQVFDKNNLELIYSINKQSGNFEYPTEGIVIKDKKAYVAINNGFEWGNEVGLIGIVDLEDKTYLQTIDLGENGKNPDNIMLKNDQIFTLNNKDFSGSSISTYNLNSNTVTTTNLTAISSGCGTSTEYQSSVLYQENGGNTLSRFDPALQTTTTNYNLDKTFYGIAIDETNDLIYASTTDFVTYGKIHIYDNNFLNPLYSFNAGIAPSAFAFQLKDATATPNITQQQEPLLQVFPNPSTQKIIHLQSALPLTHYAITDLNGKLIKTEKLNNATTASIQLTEFKAGMYILKTYTNNPTHNFVQKITIIQ